jgi:hypothetical protein
MMVAGQGASPEPRDAASPGPSTRRACAWRGRRLPARRGRGPAPAAAGGWPLTARRPTGCHTGRPASGTWTQACHGRSSSGRSGSPRLARTLKLSRHARDQSSWPSRPSRSSNRWSSRCHIPARCQSRSRRQQVTGLPQPSQSVRSSRQGAQCAAGRRCRRERLGHRREGDRRSGMVEWGAAAGWPATAARGRERPR